MLGWEIDHAGNLPPGQVVNRVMLGDLCAAFLRSQRWAKVNPKLKSWLFGLGEGLGTKDGARSDIDLAKVVPGYHLITFFVYSKPRLLQVVPELKSMKVKYSILLVIPLVALLLSFSAQAQEETPVVEGPEPFHREINFNEDRTLIYDHPSQNSTVIRDTLHVAPRPINRATKPESPKEASKTHNDDALSFNFLYYMIQKFKLSDLIDHQQ